MISFSAFPKIFALGTTYIQDIFSDEVEITEKLDGSQFVFGVINGEFVARSKGRVINGDPDKLFAPVYDWAQSVVHTKLMSKPDILFYGETLATPKHNTLKYKRVPYNHFALFGVQLPERWVVGYKDLTGWAGFLDCDVVPLLYQGKIHSVDELKSFMNSESVLGEANIEGVVVKNYNRHVFLDGGRVILPFMAGKYVSEAFKEVHKNSWVGENTTGGKFTNLCASYKTNARWHKAIQHLRDEGKLTDTPKDIGILIPELLRDITEECKDDIKEHLWNIYNRDIFRYVSAGFPEFYKEYLLNKSTFDAEFSDSTSSGNATTGSGQVSDSSNSNGQEG